LRKNKGNACRQNQRGKITKKWIERCLPQEYRRRYVKSEQSSLSGKAKKLEKIMIVDNKGKTIAWEEPSPYNSSTTDNNSAFTQPRRRDAIQPIQNDTPNNLGLSENGEDDGFIGGQEWEEAFLKALMMTEAEHLSGAEIKFTIPKERYEEIKTAMSNGSNCCYLIFDRNTGLMLRSESSENMQLSYGWDVYTRWE